MPAVVIAGAWDRISRGERSRRCAFVTQVPTSALTVEVDPLVWHVRTLCASLLANKQEAVSERLRADDEDAA